jgi:hypothetical protein
MNDEPAISKKGIVPLFISTMYKDTNRDAVSVSPMHQRRYMLWEISLYLPIRYSHPRVMEMDTSTMQKSIVALNANE